LLIFAVSRKQIESDNGLENSKLATTLDYEASASPATKVKVEAKVFGFDLLPEDTAPPGLDPVAELEKPLLPETPSLLDSSAALYFGVRL